MWQDPIVAEVRQIREKIAEEWGYSFHEMLEQDRKVCIDWRKNASANFTINQKTPAPLGSYR